MDFKNSSRMGFALALVGLLWSASVSALPTLWGVDEDDGELFRIDDYTNPAGTLTSYGQFKWNNNGNIQSVGNDIEAFTIRSDGMAYMILDDDLGGENEPVLLRFDMNTASTTQDNVVDVVGNININFDTSDDDLTGIDFDPSTGEMYVLFEDYNHKGKNRKDRLLRVDATTGNVLDNDRISDGFTNKGKESVKLGEDMVFHENGSLLVVDQEDDDVYYMDPANAELTGLYDGDSDGGLPGNTYFEALAWDSENDQLVAFSDNGNFFALITSGNGSNSSYGGAPGLTDVEGLAFWNSSGGGGGGIPVPGTALLLGLGFLAGMRKRRGST
ncbi:MAG: hypothetical protein ACPGUC_02770 [Gammaproteobacteria bacterium]